MDLWRFNLASFIVRSLFLKRIVEQAGVAPMLTVRIFVSDSFHVADIVDCLFLSDYFNDLVTYQPSAGTWTWVAGDVGPNNGGTYGTKLVPVCAALLDHCCVRCSILLWKCCM